MFGFGQSIDTDRPIEGALSPDAPDDIPASLTIRHLPPAAISSAALYSRADDGLTFAAPNAGTYNCRADAIDVVPRPGADRDEVAALLIATAIPASLWMQGRFVLHASAVRLPGSAHAIAFAGASGIGKSIVAAGLLTRGADLLADDSVALEWGAGTVMASGLSGGYFEVTPGSAERRFISVQKGRSVNRAALGALFILSIDDEPSLDRLAPLAAATRLLANRHRPKIPAILDLYTKNLAASVLLAGAIPIYDWRRKRGKPLLDETEWALLRAASP